MTLDAVGDSWTYLSGVSKVFRVRIVGGYKLSSPCTFPRSSQCRRLQKDEQGAICHLLLPTFESPDLCDSWARLYIVPPQSKQMTGLVFTTDQLVVFGDSLDGDVKRSQTTKITRSNWNARAYDCGNTFSNLQQNYYFCNQGLGNLSGNRQAIYAQLAELHNCPQQTLQRT